MGSCIFCQGKLDHLLIKKYNRWSVYLNDNQYYLGRVYVALNRHGPESTPELFDDEWTELKKVLDYITNTLNCTFDVDLFSYLVLQNKDRNHFHVHIIPRYETERKFQNIIFKDDNWGKSPIPTPVKEVPSNILLAIKEKISNFQS